MHRILALLASIVAVAGLAAFGIAARPALAAGGGTVTFQGGTAREQAAVRSALGASSFDWAILPQTVVVHIGAGDSYSTAGNVYLGSSLLDSGRFAWGVVQHEFAHQVDFMLFDNAKRAAFNTALGGKDWCYSVLGLAHADHGCERFASELAWAYWPSADNSMMPLSARDEAAAMPVASFRALLASTLGVPSLAAAPAPARTFAAVTVHHAKRPAARVR